MFASYHNLYFINELVQNARNAIKENRFLEYKKEFLSRYMENNDENTD